MPKDEAEPRLPIFLLADSKPLFRSASGGSVLGSLRRALPRRAKAAYLGASNGDDPAFYSIFEAAMDAIEITERRMITSAYTDADQVFLSDAQLLLLAGGDVARGWDVFTQTGMRDAVVERLDAGALCVGVSAGAVQLGLQGWRETSDGVEHVFDTFEVVPRIIDVHDEAGSWRRLGARLRAHHGHARGLGIPFGGVVVYHPNGRLEAQGRPAVELSLQRGQLGMTEIAPTRAGEEPRDLV
ncbi:Type 1 glutamine amidotransferase-like domain-containing protein [Candidatus Entotheonella palauensis]|uniref:Type 1 glutamine amidotransferase-like domain-containing protein n=1 Tax=Candidatus Entotheonella palauensis TaxID=93172 RepID=UPI0011788BBB|nr:Type 1 glutamine amidotransferase-like domain-containing protein [Candidatus Entotheonella palauensis]